LCRPFNVTNPWSRAYPGGYQKGQWVCYNNFWYCSKVDNNTNNPEDRTVWSNPYTFADILALLNTPVPKDGHTPDISFENKGGKIFVVIDTVRSELLDLANLLNKKTTGAAVLV
jgi:hypothetical protein